MNRMARRGPWLPEEDRTLLHLVQTQGANNWVRISQQLQHRSPKQCRERYHQNLKPSLKHEPISAQEGEIIEQMVSEMGKRWAEIARHLGNRSDNAVKNWWNGSMNRRRRNPTQASTGFKQMGSRMRPIPFANAERPSYTSRPANSLLHYSSRDPTHAPPPSHHSHSSTAPLPPSFPEPVYSPRYPSQGTRHLYNEEPGDRTPRHRIPLPTSVSESSQSHESTSVSTPHPHQTFSKPVLSRAPTAQHHRPDLPPLRQSVYTTSSETRTTTHDLPLVSPALSEMSQSVRQAPSLVSDNLSTCSISPKTVTSPHLSILTALDGSTQHWSRGPGAMLPLPLSADSKDRQKKDYLSSESTRNQPYDTLADVSRTKDSRMHLSSLLG